MALKFRNPPEPKIERIANLINRIESGDIKIPKFQRGFVWQEEQILKLLESIYQGYPIGSLLFWLSEQPMKSERNIGGFELPQTPDKYPRNYVLDGQQRLTTIYGVINWPEPKKLHKLNVYFDLQKLNFYHYNGEENDKHVPMSILFKTSEILKMRTKLSQYPNAENLQKEIDVIYETFREYLIPVVTIKEKTVEEVCPVFERINSTGTQLNVFDLMVAATWTDDFDLNDQVNIIKDSTKLKDFENINNSAFLKIMAGIHGFGTDRDSIFKLRQLKSEVLIKLANTVKVAMERSIDFLSTDLSVPSDAFLPYENQLVVFTYFFSKESNPNPEQLKALRKWFWQTGFSEHFRGASDGVLSQEISSVDNLIEGQIDALNVKVSLVENDLLKRQFWKKSSFCKTLAVMLANKKPRNITNGERIDTAVALSYFNMKEFHHVFPKDFLKRIGVSSERRNNICNICLLTASQNKIISNEPPSKYLREYFEKLGTDNKIIFNSNLIPFEADAAWRIDDFDSFLKERAKFILSDINNLCM